MSVLTEHKWRAGYRSFQFADAYASELFLRQKRDTQALLADYLQIRALIANELTSWQVYTLQVSLGELQHLLKDLDKVAAVVVRYEVEQLGE